MEPSGVLRNCDEASRVIEGIPDPVTKMLVNMAFVHLVKTIHFDKAEAPETDLDMRFVVNALREFFSEHEVIARTLEGRRVGAWFESKAEKVAKSPV